MMLNYFELRGAKLVEREPSPEILAACCIDSSNIEPGSATWCKHAEPLVLNNRNFRGANLEKAILCGSALRETDFSPGPSTSTNSIAYSLIPNVHFIADVYRGGDFNMYHDIYSGRRTNLQEAILLGADLYGANLRYADLYGANLSGANLMRAKLQHADFFDANLSGADLYDANLSGADLFDANLSGANLRGANLSDAGLRHADLSDVDLRHADLYRANLSGANLRRANLYDANLRYADLYGAIFWGANISEADFTNAKHINIELSWVRMGSDTNEKEYFPKGIPQIPYQCPADFDISDHIDLDDLYYYVTYDRSINEEKMNALKNAIKDTLTIHCPN